MTHKNLPDLEHRSYNFDVQAEKTDSKAVIIGRPIIYDSRTNIGMFDEIICNGALNKTNLNDVRFLVNHDTSKIPLARSRRNNENSTMQLTIDNDGMNIRVELDVENNSEARALYSAVQRGDITGMSFAFGVEKDDWENLSSDHPTRFIRSISSVVEVSAVTFPAYDATSINARDSKVALENARSALEKAKGLMDDLALLKEKAKAQIIIESRYNHNHGANGRFTSGGGGGRVGGGGSSSVTTPGGKKVTFHDEPVKNLTSFLRNTNENQIAMRTTKVKGDWDDVQFDAGRAGFSVSKFRAKELEAKREFSECYLFSRKN